MFVSKDGLNCGFFVYKIILVYVYRPTQSLKNKTYHLLAREDSKMLTFYFSVRFVRKILMTLLK